MGLAHLMLGPTLLFDKSFLQGLSLDEAAMLDQMFRCIISPLFFVETMADLAKEEKGRDPLRVIRGLADRTPVAHSYMNTFHSSLILGELLGRPVPMMRQPIMAGGIPVRTDGKEGIVFELSPEAEAFQRWQKGQFSEVERMTANLWRASLEELDLPGIGKSFKSMLRREERPRNHADARETARAILGATGHDFRLLMLAHELLDMPAASRQSVIQAWKAAGNPPMPTYAPYTAHCLEVDLYFYLAISNGIISDQRASNRRDIDYLYYLPFANIFVSSDKLHRAAVEQFLHSDQQFAWGPDFKADLAAINAHFLALPEEVKAEGLFTLVDRPPIEHQGLCADLWDKHQKNWRQPKLPMPKLLPEVHAELMGRSDRMVAAARSASSHVKSEPPPNVHDHLIIERSMPAVRGSWRMFKADIDAPTPGELLKTAGMTDDGPVAA
jgi:hypothetical protein